MYSAEDFDFAPFGFPVRRPDSLLLRFSRVRCARRVCPARKITSYGFPMITFLR